jgi:hypothetical protein
MANFILQGTTPTLVFDVDMDLREISILWFTMKQCGDIVVDINLDSARITIEQRQIRVTLTQQETLALCSMPSREVEMQFRGKFADGTTVGCPTMEASVEKILHKGVI